MQAKRETVLRAGLRGGIRAVGARGRAAGPGGP